MLKTTLIASVLTVAMAVAVAQSPAPSQGGRGTGRGGGMPTPYTALLSPEVHPDRTVTLRFRAPNATQVEVVGEILQGKGSLPMKKGEDGVWIATLGPLPPEIWVYNFRVQGVDVADPSNPAIKPVPPGFAMSSFARCRGTRRLFTIPGPYRTAKSGWPFMSRKQWE